MTSSNEGRGIEGMGRLNVYVRVCWWLGNMTCWGAFGLNVCSEFPPAVRTHARSQHAHYARVRSHSGGTGRPCHI